MSSVKIIGDSEGVWKPDPFMKLPKGAHVKVLRQDKKNGVIDYLIRWPEGFVEPRHTHVGSHSVIVIKGRVITEGKELGPGSYVYGPSNKPHGPFEWHDNCIVFVHFEGDPVHHFKKTKR